MEVIKNTLAIGVSILPKSYDISKEAFPMEKKYESIM